MSNFYGGLFYNGGFFGAVTPVEPAPPAGGKDDTHAGRKRLSVRRSDPFKPTGLIDRPKSKDPAIDARLAEQAATRAEIAGKLAREFAEDSAAIKEAESRPVVEMSLAEIEFEIGVLLRKKLRTQEDDAILMLLLVASAVA